MRLFSWLWKGFTFLAMLIFGVVGIFAYFGGEKNLVIGLAVAWLVFGFFFVRVRHYRARHGWEKAPRAPKRRNQPFVNDKGNTAEDQRHADQMKILDQHLDNMRGD